ncbi:hypothetical protein ABPG75_010096 [Micractinium tetrahymenae]
MTGNMLRSRLAALFTLLTFAAACPQPPDTPQLPNVTASGYLNIGAGDGEADSSNDPAGGGAALGKPSRSPRLFFLFYEAASGAHDATPITLWLQGGPGCASLFGALYELGPELVDDQLGLVPNPGAWNRKSALLFIDQPVGVGFSTPGQRRRIPRDEMTLAADLYAGLQAFFQRFPDLQARPLVIAGESYAGKYVPSIGHFILQQSTAPNGTLPTGSTAGSSRAGSLRLTERRPVPPELLAARPLLAQPPLFRLAGLAIGNGLTDPATQVMSHADVAFYGGFIDPRQRLRAMAMQLETVQLITAGLWDEAHALRNNLLEHIRASSGVATLLDMRRYEDYDAAHLVDCYLNLPAVKEALGADPAITFESCSAAVGDALGPDVMRSVKHLVPDLLAAGLPLLLYQGMHDAQDGPASFSAWIYSLYWEGKAKFVGAQRHVVRARQVEEDEAEAAAVGAARGTSSALLLPGRWAAQQPRGSAAGRATNPSDDGGPGDSAAASKRRGGPGEAAVAYWKAGGGLSHVVLTRAGHMTPRDDPATTRWMLERWLAESVLASGRAGAGGTRDKSPRWENTGQEIAAA